MNIEEVLFDWWLEFDEADETVRLEDMYERWSRQISHDLPEFKDMDFAINNMAITKNKFLKYFKDYFYDKGISFSKD